jgi:hypothetical protein
MGGCRRRLQPPAPGSMTSVTKVRAVAASRHLDGGKALPRRPGLQQNCFGVSFLCRNPTFRKNPRKYRKTPILPEDSRSQKTRRRGATRGPHHLVARARPGRARGWCGRLSHCLEPSFRLHIASDLKTSGVRRFSQIEFRCVATTRNRDSEPETPFWHPAGTGYWRRSSLSSAPKPLHQPSMIPPSMCE